MCLVIRFATQSFSIAYIAPITRQTESAAGNMSSESLASNKNNDARLQSFVKKRAANPQLNRIKLSRQVFKDSASVRSSRRGGDGSVYGGSRRGEDRSSTDSYLGGGSSRKTKQMHLENTYKLEPDKVFPYEKVEGIMNTTMKEYLQSVKYDSSKMGQLSCSLAEVIKEKVKSLNVARYKVVCYVMICQQQESSVRVASRGLWDTQCDMHATATFENGSLNAVALVYGIYQE